MIITFVCYCSYLLIVFEYEFTNLDFFLERIFLTKIWTSTLLNYTVIYFTNFSIFSVFLIKSTLILFNVFDTMPLYNVHILSQNNNAHFILYSSVVTKHLGCVLCSMPTFFRDTSQILVLSHRFVVYSCYVICK